MAFKADVYCSGGPLVALVSGLNFTYSAHQQRGATAPTLGSYRTFSVRGVTMSEPELLRHIQTAHPDSAVATVKARTGAGVLSIRLSTVDGFGVERVLDQEETLSWSLGDIRDAVFLAVDAMCQEIGRARLENARQKTVVEYVGPVPGLRRPRASSEAPGSATAARRAINLSGVPKERT